MNLQTALAVRHHTNGDPKDVLAVEPIDVPVPQPDEAVVALRCASINPSDMGMIGGSYGRLRALPAIAGREGVGEVVAVGADVKNVTIGTRVRFPEEPGVWREAGTFKAADLIEIPENVPTEQAAQAFVNGLTAYVLLETFANDLKPGDWVIQNAASSALGFALTQLCRARGLKTISVVRDLRWENMLKEAGADIVLLDDDEFPKQLKELTNGGAIRLGINTVGGNSVWRQIKSMADGGTIVTLGGASTEAIRFPTRFLIFSDLRLRGFWMDKWNRTHSREEYLAALKGVFELMAAGVLKMPVEKIYPIAEAKAAVARNLEKGRMGKVMLSGNWKL